MFTAAVCCLMMGGLAALQPFGVEAAAGGPPRDRSSGPVATAISAGRTAAQVSARLVLDGIAAGNAGAAPTAPVPAPTIALASLHLAVPLAPLAPLVPLVGPPGPVAQSVGAWAELRRCESGGNYATDTGNGYYGAYQFSLQTWRGLGYPGLPSDAPPAVQDQAASRLQARSGWGQWPACSRRLGL